MIKELTKKIVAGKYKNLTITLPATDGTRSTKSIIKESLFDSLQYDIVGENFVEVFGGSGSIGLEALSRGAKHAYFFEKDDYAYKVLCKNCLNIAKQDTTCTFGNSFVEFPKFISKLTDKAYFYFDPPFSIREGMEEIYEKTLEIITLIPKELSNGVIVEHMSKQKMPEMIGEYKIRKTKKFGKSTLSYYI